MLSIDICNDQSYTPIDLKIIEDLIKSIFEVGELEKFGELSVSFVDDKRMKQLNSQYRGIEASTDVLSFSQDEGMPIPLPDDENCLVLLGDIIISIPRADKQAKEAGHSLLMEVTILLIHGILHLFGYDHDNIYQEAFMKKEEKNILKGVTEKYNKL